MTYVITPPHQQENSSLQKTIGTRQGRDVDYIQIESDVSYYNSTEQARRLDETWFTDTYSAASISGSTRINGLFSRLPVPYDITASKDHAYLSSSAVDAYRQGTEITQNKHWTAGIVKILAGTPGHFVSPLCFGENSTLTWRTTRFSDTDKFNPVDFVGLGDAGNYYEGSIKETIESVSVLSDGVVMNGIIEPLTIRSVINMSSIHFPIEPHSVRGSFESGNGTLLGSSETVTSVDYFEPLRVNATPFLDAVDILGMTSDSGSGVSLGPSSGFFNTAKNDLAPFEDATYARGEKPSSTYASDLLAVIQRMPKQETTYLTRKECSAATGFVYNGGRIDSIAFGGLSY